MPTLLILDDYNFRGRGGQYPAVSTNLINKIMKMINVYLDDVRAMPKGFDVNPKTAQECIKLLKKGNVKLLSLDHDLGEEKNGTGYDVAVWIEEQAFKKKIKRIEWRIHSDNPVGIQNMKRAMQSADRFWDRMGESVIKNFTEFVRENT
jgi:hypothetical protein